MISLFLFTQQVQSAGTLSWHYINYQTWDQWRSDFDIRYVYNGYSYPTSYNNYGWWPAFKVDDGNLVYILGRNNGEASSNNVYVKTKLSQPLGDNYMLVQWIVTNQDTEPHYVSLASHTDVQIIYNDRARVDWYGGNRGLTMTQDLTYSDLYNTKLTLLARDGYGVTNVDDFWFGQWDYYNQHYWENRTDTAPLTNTDSAFSIGWRKRAIYPNQTLTFGVLLGVGDNLKSPPIITVTNNFQQNYNPNTKVTVTVKVQDYDADETTKLYYNFTDGTTVYTNVLVKSWTSGSGGLSDTVSFDITLGSNVSSYPLTVWAEDSFGYTSNVFTKQLLVNQAPRLTITNTIASTYYTGGTVDVQGMLWDDTYAVISYQFDDDFSFSVNSQIDCYNTQVPFRKTFALRENILSYGSHVLHIWATDQFGVKSTQYDFPFTYVQLHAPEIQLTTSSATVHYNDVITVSGKFRDLDVGDTLTLSVKYPTDDPTAPFNPFYTVTSQGAWIDFEFEYTIPHLDAGNYQLIFIVVDQRGSNSPDATFTFTNVKYPNPSPVPSPSAIDNELPSSFSGYIDSNETTTYVPSYTSDSNGDPTITYVPSNTSYYFITQSEPPPKRTPGETPTPDTPTPSASEAEWANAGSGAASNSNSNQNKKKLVPIIAGAAAAVGVAAIAAAAILIHEARIKAKEFDPEDPDLYNGPDGNAAQENENPLYNEDAQDDPFADEFDEEAPNDGNNMLPQ